MKKIGVITGGSSSEREISLRSANNVGMLLRQSYNVTVFDFPIDLDTFLKCYQDYNLFIPLIHGRGGEDGTLQGFLETLGKPYLFSGVQAQAIAIDKEKTKDLVSKMGVPIAPSLLINKKSASISYERPVVVKPYDGGSSIATIKIDSQEGLNIAIQDGFAYSEKLLIEEYIQGQEFTVAVIEETSTLEALPVILIQPKTGFFDYTSKYNSQSLANEICPAPISDELTNTLKDLALLAHKTIGCRHVSRSDFIVDQQGIPRFLEINTIPGMTEQSLLPKALNKHGTDLATALREWIEAAS